MFKSLHVKNFQSHRNTKLEFSPGINLIIGDSQDGKTACTIRPLNLISKNRPLGARYFSRFSGGDGSTEIYLVVKDRLRKSENLISLEKHIKLNEKTGKKEVRSTEYRIDGGEPFSDLPDQVIDLLNLSELNIQGQLDKHFLITESPGEVARTINTITRLDKADEWIKELNSEINNSNRSILELRKQLDRKKLELNKYSDLGTLEALIKKVDILDSEIVKYEGENEFITNAIRTIGDLDYDIDILKNLLKTEDIIIEAESLSNEVMGLKNELDLIGMFLDLDYGVFNLGEYFKDLWDINVDIDSVDKSIDGLYDELELIGGLLNLDKERGVLVKRYEDIKSNYSGILKKLGKCPLCFGNIDNNRIEIILKGI